MQTVSLHSKIKMRNKMEKIKINFNSKTRQWSEKKNNKNEKKSRSKMVISHDVNLFGI